MNTPTEIEYTPISQPEVEAIQSLRHKGYAVVIFDPEELQGASRRLVEDSLVSQAWDIIEALKD
jgi:hypothetical protein